MHASSDSYAILIGVERTIDHLRWVAIDTTGAWIASGADDGGGADLVPALASAATRLGPLADRVVGIGLCGAAGHAGTTDAIAPGRDLRSMLPVPLPGDRHPRRWLPAIARDALVLGAVPAIDIPLASGDDRFDLVARRWDEARLEQAGVDPRDLPPAVPPGTRVGVLDSAIAAATGLPAGVAIAAPSDHLAAAAFAAGHTFANRLLALPGDPLTVVAILPADRLSDLPPRVRHALRHHIAAGLALYVGDVDATLSLADVVARLADDIGFPADAAFAVSEAPRTLPATGAALLAGVAAGEYVDLAAARRVAVHGQPAPRGAAS
jgi:hypothetical protein